MMTNTIMNNDTVDSERGTLRRRGSLSSAATGRPGQVRRTGTAGSTQQGEQYGENPVNILDIIMTQCTLTHRTHNTDRLYEGGKDFAQLHRHNKVRKCIYKDDPPLIHDWLLRQFTKAPKQYMAFLTIFLHLTLDAGTTTLSKLNNIDGLSKIIKLNLSTSFWHNFIDSYLNTLTQYISLQDMFGLIPQLDGSDDGQSGSNDQNAGWQTKAGKKDLKGKAKNSGASGAGGSKRGGASGGDGGQPPKRPKQTFAEKTREGIVVEFRSSVPGAPLVQEDFDHLERTILQHYLDIPEPTFAYRTINSGISQGGVWYACENQETADFLINLVPGIDPPEGMGAYSYVVGNGELRYIKLKLPTKLWMSRERLVKSLRCQNPSLQTYLDENGQRVQARFHVTAGLEPDREAAARQQPYTYVTIEVHVNTVQAIVDLNGEVLIGNSRVRVTGAGIDQLIAERDNNAALQNNNDA